MRFLGVLLLGWLLVGCGNDYTLDEGEIYRVESGEIISKKAIGTEDSYEDALYGALFGGLLGALIADENDQALGIIGGATAGGLLGAQYDDDERAYEYIIEKSNGRELAFVLSTGAYRVGDWVRLVLDGSEIVSISYY